MTSSPRAGGRAGDAEPTDDSPTPAMGVAADPTAWASSTDAPTGPADADPANEDTVAGADIEAGAATEDMADEIDAELVALAAERDSLRELVQRTKADFDNYRKRMQTQVRDEADRASGKLAEAMLPVLDATEAAYLRHPDEVGPLLNLMLGELRKQGLEALDLEGQAFDPNLADAVAHEAGDGGEIVVAEVLRSGYRWRERTLRPAMVRTADRAEADAAEDGATEPDAPGDAEPARS